MSSRELVRQLISFKEGRPVPRYSTIHVYRMSNPLIVAFLRQAGESRPWGIAFGRAEDEHPQILCVPDGRNRDLVAEMCKEFAEYMFDYFRVEGEVFNPITKENAQPESLPQVWLPGDKHVEMFHFLEYAFWKQRKNDDRKSLLSTLARLSGWIYRESTLKGQQVVIDAAKTFQDSYVFPTDNSGLGHLGACLEWFGDGTLQSKRISARNAGFVHVSPSVDTQLDDDVFEPLLSRRLTLIRENKNTKQIEAQIEEALTPELERRWRLTQQAHSFLLQDERPDNSGVIDLVADTLQSYCGNFQRIERNLADDTLGPAFTRHPETDFHGSAAASHYFVANAAESQYMSVLVHEDSELQMELLRKGDAYYATVLKVWDEGSGRKTIPVWKLRTEVIENLRLRDGERYSPLGSRKHAIQVREIDVKESKIREFEAEWITNKTVPLMNPIDASLTSEKWVGKTLMFVPSDSSDLDFMSSQAVWTAKSGPGAWLTHGTPPLPVDSEVVDDVTQLEEKPL